MESQNSKSIKKKSSSVAFESKSMVFHSMVYSLGNFLSQIVGFFMIPIYTRFLRPYEYGVLELVGITTELFGMILTLRISRAMYRFYFEYDDEKNQNEVISSSIIIFGLIGMIGLGLGSLSSGFLAKHILDSSSLSSYFIISFTTLWFNTIGEMSFTYTQIKKKSLIYISFSLLKLIVALSFNIYFIVYRGLGVLGMLYGNLIAAIVIVLLLTTPILTVVGFRFSLAKVKEMLSFSLPMMPGAIANFLVLISDRYMVKMFGSLSDAGIYSLSYKFGTLPHKFVTVPFFQIWSVRRFELFKNSESEVVMGKIITYFMFILFFIGLGISVLIKDIIQIISDEQYWSAYKYIPILVLSYIVFGLFNHFATPILISKKTKYLSYIDIINGIITVALNIVMIKYYGIYGASFATLFSYSFRIILLYYLGNKLQKIYFESLRVFKILCVSMLVFILCYNIEMHSIVMNLSVKFLIAVLFPIYMLLVNFYSKEELLWIRSLSYKLI